MRRSTVCNGNAWAVGCCVLVGGEGIGEGGSDGVLLGEFEELE